jgi:hypothetical protein
MLIWLNVAGTLDVQLSQRGQVDGFIVKTTNLAGRIYHYLHHLPLSA